MDRRHFRPDSEAESRRAQFAQPFLAQLAQNSPPAKFRRRKVGKVLQHQENRLSSLWGFPSTQKQLDTTFGQHPSLCCCLAGLQRGVWDLDGCPGLNLLHLLKKHKFSTSLRSVQGSKLLSMATRVSLWRTFPLLGGEAIYPWVPHQHVGFQRIIPGNVPSLGKPSPFMVYQQRCHENFQQQMNTVERDIFKLITCDDDSTKRDTHGGRHACIYTSIFF